MELAKSGGLEVGNGIVVNEYLETSSPDIYAAGDDAFFPYRALGQPMRIEHWDNALNQGKWAGRNMAGAHEPFTYQPYFFSDLFEFGYEATGEVDSRLETFADWQKENDTGVIYYQRDGMVRGVMMCNVWDKVETARELIRKGERMTPEKLRGLIR
jgi:NADPH-dependent 2,4-dienoyl-CoA reductase/sulfur reductase-like enzyme